MKNQTTIESATITLAIDDLQLIQESLSALKLQKIGLGSNQQDDINRLYHALSLVIYNDVCSSNSESALMNS